MNYWLIKSEPEEYSFQDLLKDGKTIWSGVRNYAARNFLRQMKEGDLVLFYHSVLQKEVVGICKVDRKYYADPTAESGDWSAVDVVPVKTLNQAVPLSLIKESPHLQNIGLVRIGRLSVMPLEEDEFHKILEFGKTKL
jgi:predicted RNA-binding protein with PUA-like domain